MLFLWTVDAAATAKSLQLCPTLCDPIESSPPGSSVHGISQARILEWVAISFPRRSSQPSHQTHCMSVFVPVPYCFDDCGFVAEPEVRQVDSSSWNLILI